MEKKVSINEGQLIDQAKRIAINEGELLANIIKLRRKIRKIEEKLPNFATKDELAFLGARLDSDITNLQEQINHLQDYVNSSIEALGNIIQAQLAQIVAGMYTHYRTFDINSNARWTFTDYDSNYWHHFYITVRLTGNRLVEGMLEVPSNTSTTTEMSNVISDTSSGSSNNLRFQNGTIWVDNWLGEPIYVTQIRVLRKGDI